MNKIIKEERNNVKGHAERIKELEAENEELIGKYQELSVEKDLQHKQAEFYKGELGQLKVELERKER